MEEIKDTPVSKEMNAVLNRIAGDMPKQTEETRSYLVDRHRGAGYARCTWWDGCYYCQDEEGNWKLVSCAA